MQTLIIRLFIHIAFYVLGAYATTDILRLLKGSTLSVSHPDCFCPHCGQKIALRDQIPVLSWLLGHGRCRSCQARIPVSDLFLEVFLFAALSLAAWLLQYRFSAFFVCIAIYELTKLAFLLKNGKRERDFRQNLVRSLLHNLFLFLLIAVLFGLAQLA